MFKARVQKLKDQINQVKLDAVFISSVSSIEYLTGYSNFSKDEREAYILMGKNFQYIITDGRYTEAVRKQIPHLEIFERGQRFQTEDLFKKLKTKIKILGIEEDNLTVAEHRVIKKHFKNIKHFETGKLRSIKEKEEIEKIKKACEIGDKAFKYILKKINIGVSEKQIALELEKFINKFESSSFKRSFQDSLIRENGAEFSFSPIVAYGANSSVPHHQTSDKRLTIDDKLILLDFGVKVNGYCSDMTRSVVFGKASQKQKNIYDTVLMAQQKAVEFLNKQIKSGKKIKALEIDQVSREYIRSKGYPDIPHSLGHGIGLEVHEHPYISPKSKEYIEEGMIFSIEPGIYMEGFGGVRIEDLFLVEKTGLRQITTSSKELIEI